MRRNKGEIGEDKWAEVETEALSKDFAQQRLRSALWLSRRCLLVFLVILENQWKTQLNCSLLQIFLNQQLKEMGSIN